MDIRNYTSDFHDGALINIQHINDTIQFSLISAEIWDENLPNIKLTEDHRIKGKLHLKGIQSIKIDDIDFTGVLTKEYDSGSIFDFSITDHIVTLVVGWINYPPKKRVQTDLFCYKIVAKEIYWEPVPELVDPHW